MWRIVEFLLIFIGAPTLFTYTRHRLPAIPALWVLMSYCLFVLLRDPTFDRGLLWNAAGLGSREMMQATALWLFGLVLGTVLIRRYAHELFLELPRSNTRLWALIMVLYPVFSVYPQGIIYRAFLFHRYRDLLGPAWLVVLVSALAFAYVHIIFRNRLAVGLTFLGGIIFAFRYWQTGSLLASALEHALYGCAIFTIGLGRSFYHAGVVSSRRATLP